MRFPPKLADLLCPDGWRLALELSRTLGLPESVVVFELKKFSFYEFRRIGSFTAYRRS
jgi:hypothetical protein